METQTRNILIGLGVAAAVGTIAFVALRPEEKKPAKKKSGTRLILEGTPADPGKPPRKPLGKPGGRFPPSPPTPTPTPKTPGGVKAPPTPAAPAVCNFLGQRSGTYQGMKWRVETLQMEEEAGFSRREFVTVFMEQGYLRVASIARSGTVSQQRICEALDTFFAHRDGYTFTPEVPDQWERVVDCVPEVVPGVREGTHEGQPWRVQEVSLGGAPHLLVQVFLGAAEETPEVWLTLASLPDNPAGVEAVCDVLDIYFSTRKGLGWPVF